MKAKTSAGARTCSAGVKRLTARAGRSTGLSPWQCAAALIAAVCISTCKNNPSGPAIPLEQNLQGTWYASCNFDTVGPPAVFALEFLEQGLVEQYFMNCDQKLVYLRGAYDITGDTVPVMPGTMVSGVVSTGTMPSGGFIRIYIMEADGGYPRDYYITFMESPGSYCVPGVAPGEYLVSAMLFSKSDVLALVSMSADTAAMDSLLSSIPMGHFPSRIVVGGEARLNGIDFDIPSALARRASGSSSLDLYLVRLSREWIAGACK